MINKIKSLTNKQWLIIAGALLLVVALVVTICLVCNRPQEGEIQLENIKEIEITEADMKQYRERIGSDMDIKKAYLILFEDEQSCRTFIVEHGSDQNPTAAGIGIIPMMEDGYYNIVGKHTIEEAFDSLADGEYSKEPCILMSMDDKASGFAALVENLQRQDLDFIEEAMGIRRLIQEHSMSQEQIGRAHV